MTLLKSSRFFFLSLYVQPSSGTEKHPSNMPPESTSVICCAKAYLLPAKFFLTNYLTEGAFAHYLLHKKAKTLLQQQIAHTSFSVSLWSAQEQLLNQFVNESISHIPLQGLSPLAPALLQSHLTPSGNFWIGTQTLLGAPPLLQKHAAELQLWLPPETVSTPFQKQTWTKQTLLSEHWALEAERQFGAQIELLGLV